MVKVWVIGMCLMENFFFNSLLPCNTDKLLALQQPICACPKMCQDERATICNCPESKTVTWSYYRLHPGCSQQEIVATDFNGQLHCITLSSRTGKRFLECTANIDGKLFSEDLFSSLFFKTPTTFAFTGARVGVTSS